MVILLSQSGALRDLLPGKVGGWVVAKTGKVRETLQLLKEMRRIFHITHSLGDSRPASSHM